MSIFKCKMCGGALDIAENATTVVCEYCGGKQTLPKLSDDKTTRLYDRAGHFRRNNEFDKASAIFEEILNENNTDAEAYWSLVLCSYGIEYVEDPATKRRIPTVNRAQFTSVFDDDNYRSALKYADIGQKAIYEAEAKEINEIQKGILTISQKEEPFDIFICYKETDENGSRTRDSVTAQELYYQLTDAGYKVFFSRITLEDKLGAAYEPYIFAALNSAKVMIVIGTKPEYYNAVWVKNEWSRYLTLVKQSGGKKILIPAYKDMDPYDLPPEFSHLQAQDMSKLGFMQDLIRGIKKIIPQEAAKPQVETYTPSANTNQLYDIKLLPYGNRKLECIKVIREITGVGLKEAKEISESSNPIVAQSVSLDKAEKIRNYFVKNGFDVDLFPASYSVVQPSYVTPKTSTGDLDTILRRVAIFIEGKDWVNANIYCEKALDIDPENSQAYLYKLLVKVQATEESQLIKCSTPLDVLLEYKNAVRFSDEETATRLVGYNNKIIEKIAEIEQQERARAQQEARRITELEELNTAKNNTANVLTSLIKEKEHLENDIKNAQSNNKKIDKPESVKLLCTVDFLLFIISLIGIIISANTYSTEGIVIFIILAIVYIIINAIILKKGGFSPALVILNLFTYGILSVVMIFIIFGKCKKQMSAQNNAELQNLMSRLQTVNIQIEQVRKSLLEINTKIETK